MMVDNASSHGKLLSNVRIEKLPPPSIMQPLDHVIGYCLKRDMRGDAPCAEQTGRRQQESVQGGYAEGDRVVSRGTSPR
jgi:hypothetical protein